MSYIKFPTSKNQLNNFNASQIARYSKMASEIYQQIFMLQANQSKHQSYQRIEVIAHRGLSSILPENTMEAIIAGLQCSDYVQLDVQLTKDNQVIVFHDKGLKRLTNISDFPEFADRRKLRCIEEGKEEQQDWWVDEFTFAELSKLHVRQPVAFRLQLTQCFRIEKFDEILRQCLKIKNLHHHSQKLHSGLLVELKASKLNQLTQKDEQLCRIVGQILKKHNLNTIHGCKTNNLPVILQSFNIHMLKSLEEKCENEFIQLFKKDTHITQEFLNKIKSERVRGIGVTERSLLDSHGKISKKLKEITKKLGYRLYYWTIRDDHRMSIPFKCKSYDEVYRVLFEHGVTGFITQFPDICKGIFHIESAKYPADVQQLAEKCIRRQSSRQVKNIALMKNRSLI